MSPSDYYYGSFRAHIGVFWSSLQEHGSVSRVRGQLTPSRFTEQAAAHFSVVDLVAKPKQSLHDHLDQVPPEAQTDFLCALVYTVLIDQVMYSHWRADYAEFRAMTQYPKMDRTVGFSRTLTMANPYELFDDDILLSRGLQRRDVEARFEEWAKFIVRDLRAFFSQGKVGCPTWADLKASILRDSSAIWGRSGASLASALRADDSAA